MISPQHEGPGEEIHVLWVDDQPDQLGATKLLLRKVDPTLQVRSASSPEEALRLLEEEAYECVVSEYMISSMDGIEFSQKVKEKRKIPFIIYTGRGSEEIAETAFAAGIDDYVRKELEPSHYRVLANRIRSAVERRRVEGLYQSVIDGSREGLSILVENKIVYCNQAQANLFGAENPGEINDCDFIEYVEPDDRDRVKEIILDTQRNFAEPLPFEVVVERRDGESRVVELSISPFNYHGKLAVLSFARDVTGRLRYEQRLEALHGYATELSKLRSIEEIAARTFDAIESVLGFSKGGFGIVEMGLIRLIHIRGFETNESFELPLDGPGVTVRTVKTGMPQLIPDIRLNEDYFRAFADEGLPSVSELSVPVKVGYEVVAVINVESTKLDAFTEEDKKLLEIFSEHVASAIRGLREQAEHKTYEERLEALHRHATELSKVETIEKVAALTINAVGYVLGFNIGGFGVVENGFLRFLYISGSEIEEALEMSLDGPGVTIRAVKTGKTQLVPDVRQDEDYILPLSVGATEPLSELVVPVKIGDETIAIINFESTEIDAFTKEDQKLIEIFAEHVASTIRRLREQAEQKRYEERLEALHSHSTELGRAETLEEIAEMTFDAIERVLGFNLGSFGIVEGNSLIDIITRGIEKDEAFERPLNGPGVTVRAVKTGETQLVPDTRLDEDFIPGLAEGIYECVSELAVPVKVNGEAVAVINVESTKLNVFTEEDRRLLEIFSEHVASAFSKIRHEEILKASEERWRSLLEASADSVIVIIGTELVYVNRRLAELIGYSSPSELIGSDLLDIIAPEYRELIRNRTLRRQRGEEEPNRYEYKLLRTDGTQLDIETQTTLIEYGGKSAALAFIRDITERKLYEERLEALHSHSTELGRAETLEEIAEMTFDAIERVLGFNQGGFGVLEEKKIRFIHIRGAEIEEEFQLPLDGRGITIRAARTGETQLVPDIRKDEDFVLGPSGMEFGSLSELVVPVIIDDEVVAVINIENSKLDAFTEDDRKLIEIFAEHVASSIRRLREQAEQQRYKERLEALHSHATELGRAETLMEIAETTFDVIHRVLGFSIGGFGVVEGDMIRFIYNHAEGAEGTFELPLDGPGVTIKVVKTGKTQLISDLRKYKDYALGPSGHNLSELAVPVKISGEVVAVINIESVEVDAFTEDDQRLLETLAQHIASAISNIQQKEMLRKSLKEVERSNRELDDYTYVVSHDLKAPLRSVLAFSAFLLEDYEDKIDDSGKEYLNRIVNASERMNQLIQDLLVLSRVGRKYTETELVELNSLVEDIKLDFEAQFEERGGRILFGELPTLRTQKVWMRQLFANLIGNGLKFNRSPTPQVEVSCDEREDDYLFSVKDNGIGIRKKDHIKLFKLFQRLHTQEEFEGTGAGLAICRKIVESQGGRIWLESQPDEGTTFYFTYPKRGRIVETMPTPQIEQTDLEVIQDPQPLNQMSV